MSEWTIETLKEYIDTLIAAQDKAVGVGLNAQRTAIDAALTSQKEAVIKAEAAAEKRFESVNEFRAQLATQQSTFVTRAEYDAELRAVKSGLDTYIKSVITKIDDLQDRLNRSEGRNSGIKDVWGYVIGAAAVGGFIIKVLFP